MAFAPESAGLVHFQMSMFLPVTRTNAAAKRVKIALKKYLSEISKYKKVCIKVIWSALMRFLH